MDFTWLYSYTHARKNDNGDDLFSCEQVTVMMFHEVTYGNLLLHRHPDEGAKQKS